MKHKKDGRNLECIYGKSMTRIVEAPTRNGVLLNLTLINREVLVGDVSDRYQQS